MHTMTVYIKKTDPVIPYLYGNMTGSRAVRNTANFLIRNVYTALGKPKYFRTPKENAVLMKVWMCLNAANERRIAAHNRKCAAGKAHTLKLLEIPDEKHRMLSYAQIDAILKLSEDKAYYSCTSQVNQQAVRKTCQSWKSFFESLKKWKKDKSSFTGRPRIPGYIRTEMTTAHFTNQVSVLSETETGLKLGFANSKDSVDLGKMPVSGSYVKAEAACCPDGCKLMLTFDDGEQLPDVPVSPERIMAVDPGTNNLAACVTNTGMRPFVIDGRYLKSANRLYNKKLAQYRSVLTKGKDPRGRSAAGTSRRIEKLSDNRERLIRDFFYKAAHAICRRAEDEGVELIVYGHNKGQKQEIGIGRVNNQNFVQIPFERFFHVLQWTAMKYGIAVVMAEESYTSKSDFLSNDPIPVYGKVKTAPSFSGKRIHRGLYKSSTGIVLNADINGAANILRKHYPEQAAEITAQDLCSVEKTGFNELYPAKKRFQESINKAA